MRSWAHAHAAEAMLTSKDLHETYRNVHSEDAEDVRTARFSEDPKKVLAGKNVLSSLVQGMKMSPTCMYLVFAKYLNIKVHVVTLYFI